MTLQIVPYVTSNTNRDIESWAGGGTPASTVTDATTYGVASAVGVSTNYAREDHAHGTMATPTKSTVGLGNVDNTADSAKPVSTAQQAALDLKANLASPTFTGTVTLPAGTVTLAMQANMATSSIIYRKTAGSGAPEVNTLATLKTDLALAKGDVGLGNVDNTSDASKPVSTATQTALDLKANLISPSFTTPILGTPTSGNLANCTFPTLNQNTTGSAAKLTTARTINGTSFDGTANITLANGSVTLAQMADVATSTVFSRKTAATGVPEVQTLATLKTDLGLTGTNSGDQTITLTGDVTGTGTGSFAATIANGAITLAKMANMATASILGRATAGSGAPEVLATTGTGNVVLANTPTLTTPNIGAATGTSVVLTGAITSSGTAGVGYATGAGGTVTQATSKSTGVTLNKLCGTITMNGAALAAATIVTFTVTNSTVAATDVIVVQHDTVGTIGGYTVMPNTSAAGSFKISVRNNTAGSLSEAIVLRFAVIKAVAA